MTRCAYVRTYEHSRLKEGIGTANDALQIRRRRATHQSLILGRARTGAAREGLDGFPSFARSVLRNVGGRARRPGINGEPGPAGSVL